MLGTLTCTGMRADNYWPEYDCADGDLDRMVFTVKSRLA
jgi:hypothetical protein